VAASSVLPGFDRAVQSRRLEGAATQLRTDIQHARSLASARGENIHLRVENDDQGACYIVHTGRPRDCTCVGTSQPQCAVGAEVLRVHRLPRTEGVNLSSNSASLLFESALGTVTPTATLQLNNRSAQDIRVVVNIMGRVRQCTTTPPQSGLPRC
jgi:type IV fimbrial biogenesis protein FimT